MPELLSKGPISPKSGICIGFLNSRWNNNFEQKNQNTLYKRRSLRLRTARRKSQKRQFYLVAEKYYEQAKSIGDAYGIEILIAELCETLFPDHNADLLLEAADIEIALNTLEEALSAYPEGFFEQLKHDVYDTIQIQLTGMLTKPLKYYQIYILGWEGQGSWWERGPGAGAVRSDTPDWACTSCPEV